jgi:hypothetical protein
MGKSGLQTGIAAAMGFMAFGSAYAVDLDGPCWKPELQDTQMALFEPHRYAWELFREINHPARLWSKCPDPSKALGDEGPVLWETWRNIAPEAERSIFLPRGVDPGPWRKATEEKFLVASLFVGTDTPVVRSVTDLIAPTKQRRARDGKSPFSLSAWRAMHRSAVAKNANEDREGTEVRLNREAYLHIRDNQLYNRDVLVARAARGFAGSLDLPPATKEIKARWMEIEEADKPRFHWVTFKNEDGTSQTWGLSALHISTKDLPNWYWTTFEHIDTAEDWVNPSFDSYTCPDNPVDCNKAPKELKGTKWEFFRLRGTQVNFVDSLGKDTVLANAQIEEGVERVSSCITCHAEAAMEADGKHRVPSDPYLGVPRADKLEGLMQTDFMFAFERASSPGDE